MEAAEKRGQRLSDKSKRLAKDTHEKTRRMLSMILGDDFEPHWHAYLRETLLLAHRELFDNARR